MSKQNKVSPNLKKITQNAPDKEDLESATYPSHRHVPVKDTECDKK